MSSAYPEDYFAVNRILMTCGGLWTPKNLTPLRYYCFKLYQLFMFMFSVVLFNASLWAGAYIHRHNVTLLIEVFNVAITIALGSLKNIFWLLRGHKIEAVIATLESEELHYEIAPSFNPGLLVKKAKSFATSLSLFYFVLGQITLGFVYLTAFVQGTTYAIRGKSIKNITSFESLPYTTYVPFDFDTPSKYLLALFCQGGPLYFHSFNLLGLDMLMMSIMNIIGVHVENLQGAFRTVRERCLRKICGPILTKDGLHNSEELEKMMMDEMTKSIKHLKTIFWVCNELETHYSLIMLGQTLSTLYLLCGNLLAVSTTPVASKEFGTALGYLIVLWIQISLYCWYGNEITLKASEIPQALWESDWLETRQPYKVCMLITMRRLRRPLHLTAGKFSPLTLSTFVSIVKGSYSYYTVLKTL